MSNITEPLIEQALRKFTDPYLDCDLVQAKAVKKLELKGGKCVLEIELGFPARDYCHELKQDLTELLLEMPGLEEVDCRVSVQIAAHAVQQGTRTLPHVKNTIAVASGKGGVGKSTTSVNLALALAAEGATVGILDADIYGPSQPRMLGCTGKPDMQDKRIIPKVNHGIQSMSIGYMIEEDTPMIWRGPMATSALEQLINDTAWQDLDYLIIDLPPGTGDIQLTLSQKIPLSGAVIVTTPQDIALLDAKKALKMFEKVNVPVLGVIENMSVHVCSNCGHAEHIFGEGGGEAMAEQYDIDLLGSLPLDLRIREGVDSGNPTVAQNPDSETSQIYREVARIMAAELSLQTKDYASKFPNIVVENR